MLQRLQSSLGRMMPRYRPDMFMSGYMAVGKVTKVHHASGTCDIVLVNNGSKVTSNPTNEGRFAARLLQNSAHFNDTNKQAWGSIDPIAVGTLVVVAFMENMKHKPIILGAFPYPDATDNILHRDYPLNENVSGYQKREALKTLTVYPSMAYEKHDGEGNVERVHASKSFLKVVNTAADPNGTVSDNHLGYDHANVTEVDKRTGLPFETKDTNAQTPTRTLYVNRRYDLSTGWTKLFLDENGMTRFTRDNNDNTLSYFMVSPQGQFKFRRQLDAPDHESGTNNAEAIIDTDGSITLSRTNNGQTVTIKIGVNLDIDISTPTNVNITGGNVVLNGGTEGVARVGDHVQVDPATGLGTITSGSSTVKSG